MKLTLHSFLKKEYFILSIIILLGAFIRLQGVFSNSFAFTYDVGRDMLSLWNIAYAHKIPLIGATTGLPGVFYGPWWYFILTPFFVLFSGNPQGLAFVMSLVGVSLIFLGFLLGKKLDGIFLGLSVAGFISVSPIFISLSAQIWNPNIIPLFVILTLFNLQKIYSTSKKSELRYFLSLGILLALTTDLEIIFGTLFSAGVILSLIFIANKKISIKNISSLILGALIIIAPRIIFELRHGFLMSKSFFAYFFTKDISNQPGLSPVSLVSKFGVMLDQFNSTIASNNKLLGLIILFFVTLSILFTYKEAEERIKIFIKTSVIIIFMFIAGTLFLSHDIWPHYLVGVPVFYVFLLGLSLILIGKKISKILIPASVVTIIILLNLNPVSFYKSLITPLWEGDASVYRNQLAVVDYVYGQSQGKSFKYVVYTPGVNDYVYRYLFKWYGPAKYHYSPTEKVTTAYFILEPDYQDPTRLPDWLNKRKADGVIVKDVTVKGNIRVQTRLVH